MKEELRQDILAHSSSYITSKWIIERIPYVFSNDMHSYISWKSELSSRIEVDGRAISVVGSSAVGCSLSPDKPLREFSKDSDIDIAIVSAYHFELSWFQFRNLGTRRYRLTPLQKNALDDQRTRLIYWGTIASDKLLPILPFGLQWLNALEAMSKVSPTENRTIKMRIYKDFEALRAYQNQGIDKLKDSLILQS